MLTKDKKEELEILDIEEAKKRFFEKTIHDVINLALDAYAPGVTNGVVFFDLRKGAFFAVGICGRREISPNPYLVKVYEIPSDFYKKPLFGELKELLYAQDVERLKEKLGKSGLSEDEIGEKIAFMTLEEVSKILRLSTEELRERVVSYLSGFVCMSDLWDDIERKYKEFLP